MKKIVKKIMRISSNLWLSGWLCLVSVLLYPSVVQANTLTNAKKLLQETEQLLQDVRSPLSTRSSHTHPSHTSVRLLNKITGASTIINLSQETPSHTLELEFYMQQCLVEHDNMKLHITVQEKQSTSSESNIIFNGWLITTPSATLSSFLHPVYDITLLQCY